MSSLKYHVKTNLVTGHIVFIQRIYLTLIKLNVWTWHETKIKRKILIPIAICNKSFENVSKLRYPGITITTRNQLMMKLGEDYILKMLTFIKFINYHHPLWFKKFWRSADYMQNNYASSFVQAQNTVIFWKKNINYKRSMAKWRDEGSKQFRILHNAEHFDKAHLILSGQWNLGG
jgi:hypothetical protein